MRLGEHHPPVAERHPVRRSDVTAVHHAIDTDRRAERRGDGVAASAHSGVTYAAVIPPSMISD